MAQKKKEVATKQAQGKKARRFDEPQVDGKKFDGTVGKKK